MFAFLPSARRRRIALSGAVGVLVVLAVVMTLDLRIKGDRRDMSVQQVAENLSSLAGKESNDDLAGTVEWRQGFWQQVLDDLLSSSAWLTGLGFGEILPERYEVDVGNTNNDTSTQPLRSLHNSHLTLLARIGFPGFGLWVLLWLVFGVHLLGWIRRRSGGVRDPSTAFVVWLLAAIPGFLVGAYFDPSLEGPHVAIWLFTVVGLAAAVTRDHRVAVPATAGAAPTRLHGIASLPRVVPWPALAAHLQRLRTRAGWEVAERVLSGLIGLAAGVYVARSLGVQELAPSAWPSPPTCSWWPPSAGWSPTPWPSATAARTPWPCSGRRRRPPGRRSSSAWPRGPSSSSSGLLLPGSTGAALLGLGLTLPGLLLQDSWRHAFSAAGKPTTAIANDLVWALALAPGPGHSGENRTHQRRLGHARLGRVGHRGRGRRRGPGAARPEVAEAAEWLRRHRDLAAHRLDRATRRSAGPSQLRLYGLAVIAGMAAVGALYAAELLLGPVALLVVAAAVRPRTWPGCAGSRRAGWPGPACSWAPPGRRGARCGGACCWRCPTSSASQLLRSAWLPASGCSCR